MGGMSLEKGKRFCTSSRSDRPVDQTSARMEYSRPERRSGCEASACQIKILRDKMNNTDSHVETGASERARYGPDQFS